jgi:hypothetical protein
MRSGCSVCGGGGDREHFHGPSTSQRVRLFVSNTVKQNVLPTVIFIVFAILAFYLSWSCNTKEGVDGLMKIVYGIFAGLGNIAYVFWYFILRRKYCI